MRFGTRRPDYLGRFRNALEEAADRIKPELVLLSAGFDAHREDPIGSLGLDTEDFVPMTREVLEVAKVHAGGRVVSCLEGGYDLDASGNPMGCPNYQSWVFAQRLVIGNASIRTSNLGSPLTSGPDPVTVDPTTGKISQDDQVTNTGDVATFASGNPFVNMSSGDLKTLPSGQVLYVTETAIQGFSMPPFAGPGVVYSYNVF